MHIENGCLTDSIDIAGHLSKNHKDKLTNSKRKQKFNMHYFNQLIDKKKLEVHKSIMAGKRIVDS